MCIYVLYDYKDTERTEVLIQQYIELTEHNGYILQEIKP